MRIFGVLCIGLALIVGASPGANSSSITKETMLHPAGPTIDSAGLGGVGSKSASSASTTDDFIAGKQSSDADERAEIFAHIMAKLDVRDAVAHYPPPRAHGPPERSSDTGTQTYVSMREVDPSSS